MSFPLSLLPYFPPAHSHPPPCIPSLREGCYIHPGAQVRKQESAWTPPSPPTCIQSLTKPPKYHWKTPPFHLLYQDPHWCSSFLFQLTQGPPSWAPCPSLITPTHCFCLPRLSKAQPELGFPLKASLLHKHVPGGVPGMILSDSSASLNATPPLILSTCTHQTACVPQPQF